MRPRDSQHAPMEIDERIRRVTEELVAEVASGSYGPTWLMLDVEGNIDQRHMLAVPDAVPDSVIEQMVDSSKPDGAVTHGVIRLEDASPRILGWDGQTRFVSEFNGDTPSTGVVEVFDSDPPG